MSYNSVNDTVRIYQVEELRLKLHSSTEENKRLQRALVKEIGDGTTPEQVLLSILSFDIDFNTLY